MVPLSGAGAPEVWWLDMQETMQETRYKGLMWLRVGALVQKEMFLPDSFNCSIKNNESQI